jgi:hypothetical protein
MAAVNLRDRTAEYFSTFEVLRSQMLQAEQEAASSAAALRKTVNGHARKPSALSSTPSLSAADTAPLLSRASDQLHGTGPLLPQQSQFTEAASQISKSIALVAEKLEKLTQCNSLRDGRTKSGVKGEGE